MDCPDGVGVRHPFCVTIQAGRHDPHQAAVAVVAFTPASAFKRVSLALISRNRVVGAFADIIGIAVRGERPVIQPVHKIAHDIIHIHTAGSADAVQQRQRQAAVVRPGTCGQIESTVPAHSGHRMRCNLVPFLKLNRAAQGVPDYDAHNSVFPDIPHKNLRDIILPFSFHALAAESCFPVRPGPGENLLLFYGEYGRSVV